MIVIKRDGREEQFAIEKIIKAITKAYNEIYGDFEVNTPTGREVKTIAGHVAEELSQCDKVSVEDIQDAVENALMEFDVYDVAKAYIQYRYLHELQRQHRNDADILTMVCGGNDYWSKENSNKNANLVSVQRDYLAGITSTDIARTFIFPKDVVEAHDNGFVHQHDMDYMAQNTLHNCDLINIEDMLQNGTVVNNVRIEKPHRLLTAMTILTQIMASCAANQYGGQSVNLAHVVPFVESSREFFRNKYRAAGINSNDISKLVEQDLRKEIEDSVQTFNYQISTLFTLNGQAPFCSLFIYLNDVPEDEREDLVLLAEEFFKQREKGMPNRDGVFVTQAFPKILYVLQEDNYKPGTKYWKLTKKALSCSSKRLTPDYMSEKVMKQLKVDENGNGYCFASMGCRSLLSVYIDKSGKAKFWGRWNGGVSSINLPDIAFKVDSEGLHGKRAENRFFEILSDRCEIAHRGLKIRAERLANTKAKVAPILWMDGALSRKKPDETLADMVYGGYMTISLGYVGIAEATKIITGESNAYGHGREFATDILRFLNDECDKWKKQENIGYSVYGTPAESLAMKFATKTRERYPERFKELFGNKRYFENSYHIPSSESIDPFEKIKIEGEFQKLSQGGCLSYIESSDVSKNLAALYPIIEAIYNHTMYCEINIKTSYCQVCGETQTIDVHKDDSGNTWWECANCGNKDISKMNVAARTCGYIGTNFWNDGKTQEIASRYVHLDDHSLEE